MTKLIEFIEVNISVKKVYFWRRKIFGTKKKKRPNSHERLYAEYIQTRLYGMFTKLLFKKNESNILA